MIKFLVLCFLWINSLLCIKNNFKFWHSIFATLVCRAVYTISGLQPKKGYWLRLQKNSPHKNWTLYKQLKHTSSASSTSCPSSKGCTMICLHLSPVTNLPSSRRTRLPHISARKPTAHLLRAPTIATVPWGHPPLPSKKGHLPVHAPAQYAMGWHPSARQPHPLQRGQWSYHKM